MMKPDRFAFRHPAVILFVLLFLGFISYFQTISFPFVHDDVVFIANNPSIKHLDIVDAFRPKKVGQASAELINVYYRPLVDLFHRIQYKLFGLNPAGFHFTNILLHVLNAFLLYLVLGQILGYKKETNFVIALFFLLHPLQTEAVACISGVSNILLLLFFLLSLMLYVKARDMHSIGMFAGALLLFIMGCFIKEQMVVLFMVVALYELLLRDKDKWSWWGPAGFAGALVLYFIMRRLLLGFTLTSIFDPYGEYVYRFMAIPRSLVTYLSLIFLPRGLHYYRSIDILASNTGAWIGLGILGGFVTWLIRSADVGVRKIYLFGWAWFFITLLPMLNIIPLVNEYSTILNFEHFLYVPLIGVLVFVVVLAQQCLSTWQKGSKYISSLIVVVLALLCVGLTIRQNTHWRSEVALFNRALQFQESGRIRILLGKAYYFQKDYSRAIEQYNKALAIMNNYIEKMQVPKVIPFYHGYIKGIYFDLAHCYEDLQNPDEAVIMYHKALAIDPNDEVLYNNLAVIYIKQEEFPQAIQYLEQALAINSQSQLTRQNLAYCYVQIGQKEKADQLFMNKK